MASEHDEYKYDDPDPHARRPRPERGSNRTVWIVLLSVGCGVGLLGLLACGGLIYWGVATVQNDLLPAQAAADQFLDLLKEGKADAAYDSTSANFRAAQTRAEFADFLKKFETLTRHTDRTYNGLRVFTNPAGKQAFVQATLRAPNNATTCTLTLVEEGGAWKVNKITVP